MPLVRYELRSEYELANRELYRSAPKNDPEAILEGVSMVSLVGIVRQLGDLAEFAADVFHDLHEAVMATASRSHDLMARVSQLEGELPALEKAILSNKTNPLQFAYAPGVEWHASIRNDQNHCTQGDLPRFIRSSYEECRGPPRLFLLDKFDVGGVGACLKRYTDPSFFKMEWASSEITKAEKAQQDKKARRSKKPRRRKEGDVRDSRAPPVQLPQPRPRYTSISVSSLDGLSESTTPLENMNLENDQANKPFPFVTFLGGSQQSSKESGISLSTRSAKSPKSVRRSTKKVRDDEPPIESTVTKTQGEAMGDKVDDAASETEQFLDAMTTMESETDSEPRDRRRLSDLKRSKVVTTEMLENDEGACFEDARNLAMDSETEAESKYSVDLTPMSVDQVHQERGDRDHVGMNKDIRQNESEASAELATELPEDLRLEYADRDFTEDEEEYTEKDLPPEDDSRLEYTENNDLRLEMSRKDITQAKNLSLETSNQKIVETEELELEYEHRNALKMQPEDSEDAEVGKLAPEEVVVHQPNITRDFNEGGTPDNESEKGYIEESPDEEIVSDSMQNSETEKEDAEEIGEARMVSEPEDEEPFDFEVIKVMADSGDLKKEVKLEPLLASDDEPAVEAESQPPESIMFGGEVSDSQGAGTTNKDIPVSDNAGILESDVGGGAFDAHNNYVADTSDARDKSVSHREEVYEAEEDKEIEVEEGKEIVEEGKEVEVEEGKEIEVEPAEDDVANLLKEAVSLATEFNLAEQTVSADTDEQIVQDVIVQCRDEPEQHIIGLEEVKANEAVLEQPDSLRASSPVDVFESASSQENFFNEESSSRFSAFSDENFRNDELETYSLQDGYSGDDEKTRNSHSEETSELHWIPTESVVPLRGERLEIHHQRKRYENERDHRAEDKVSEAGKREEYKADDEGDEDEKNEKDYKAELEVDGDEAKHENHKEFVLDVKDKVKEQILSHDKEITAEELSQNVSSTSSKAQEHDQYHENEIERELRETTGQNTQEHSESFFHRGLEEIEVLTSSQVTADPKTPITSAADDATLWGLSQKSVPDNNASDQSEASAASSPRSPVFSALLAPMSPVHSAGSPRGDLATVVAPISPTFHTASFPYAEEPPPLPPLPPLRWRSSFLPTRSQPPILHGLPEAMHKPPEVLEPIPPPDVTNVANVTPLDTAEKYFSPPEALADHLQLPNSGILTVDKELSQDQASVDKELSQDQASVDKELSQDQASVDKDLSQDQASVFSQDQASVDKDLSQDQASVDKDLSQDQVSVDKDFSQSPSLKASMMEEDVSLVPVSETLVDRDSASEGLIGKDISHFLDRDTLADTESQPQNPESSVDKDDIPRQATAVHDIIEDIVWQPEASLHLSRIAVLPPALNLNDSKPLVTTLSRSETTDKAIMHGSSVLPPVDDAVEKDTFDLEQLPRESQTLPVSTMETLSSPPASPLKQQVEETLSSLSTVHHPPLPPRSPSPTTTKELPQVSSPTPIIETREFPEKLVPSPRAPSDPAPAFPVSPSATKNLPEERVDGSPTLLDSRLIDDRQSMMVPSSTSSMRNHLGEESELPPAPEGFAGVSSAKKDLQEDALIQEISVHDRSKLRRVPSDPPAAPKAADEREVLLEQIRSQSFNLRHTIVEKKEIKETTPRLVTNINVAAILEKANAIRQALAGSDEDNEEDDWSE